MTSGDGVHVVLHGVLVLLLGVFISILGAVIGRVVSCRVALAVLLHVLCSLSIAIVGVVCPSV